MQIKQGHKLFSQAIKLCCSNCQLARIPSQRNGAAISMTAQRNLSTELHEGRVYEFRNYSIWPKDFKNFLELTKKYIHLRTETSKSLGYWSTEVGAINEVISIWEYDCLQHRANVRKTLAANQEWVDKYLKDMLPMLSKQDNVMLSVFPWSKIIPQDGIGGIYELQRFTYHGDVSEWSDTLQNYCEARVRWGSLVAAFYCISGPRSTSYQFWRYNDIDHYTEQQVHADPDPIFSPKRAALSEILIAGTSRILLPQPWSPMQ